MHQPNFKRMILKGEGKGDEKKKPKTIKELIITTVLYQSKLASTLPVLLIRVIYYNAITETISRHLHNL